MGNKPNFIKNSLSRCCRDKISLFKSSNLLSKHEVKAVNIKILYYLVDKLISKVSQLYVVFT